VHQASRIQHDIARTLAQPRSCQAMQLGIGRCEQRISRARISRLHSSEKLGELAQ
jgi:hypothetical protein